MSLRRLPPLRLSVDLDETGDPSPALHGLDLSISVWRWYCIRVLHRPMVNKYNLSKTYCTFNSWYETKPVSQRRLRQENQIDYLAV
jgi:hypothetical protein